MDITYSNIRSSRFEISLRHLKNKDVQSIYDNVKDKAISTYTVSIPYPYHLSDAREFISYSIRTRRLKTAYIFGIELIKNKKIIGIVSLSKIDKKNKNCELGYWLGKKYWRKQIASTAVKMILNFAFKKLKMHRVYAQVFADNTASLRVLEKNGFLLEGVSFDVIWRKNKWHNLFLYALVENDFK